MIDIAIRKCLCWSVITYYISNTDTNMKPPKKSILRNTPSGPVVKILKKLSEGVYLLVKLAVAVQQLT